MVQKVKLAILMIKDYFRRHDKTTWGKNELVKEIDEIENRILQEVSKE